MRPGGRTVALYYVLDWLLPTPSSDELRTHAGPRTAGLLTRGWSEAAVRTLLGENTLRVLAAAGP